MHYWISILSVYYTGRRSIIDPGLIHITVAETTQRKFTHNRQLLVPVLSYMAIMSQPKPTIIVVPGAFHKASHFYKLAMHLTVAGFTASVLDLPSTTDGDFEPHVYQKDVATIANAIREFTNVGREVVLVMHDYAGNPGTQAAYDLGTKAANGTEAGSHGAVVKLIYLAAWLPLEGQSLFSLPWPQGVEPFHVACEKVRGSPFLEKIAY